VTKGLARIAGWVVLAGAIGCSDATAPSQPTFVFAATRVFGVRRSPPEITAGKSSIDIQGIFEVPHPSYTVSGWLVQPDPRTLQLGVRGVPESGGPAIASLHLYQSWPRAVTTSTSSTWSSGETGAIPRSPSRPSSTFVRQSQEEQLTTKCRAQSGAGSA
jgi:hypothetical protein